MNQWIYVLSPVREELATNPTPKDAETVDRHFEHLKVLLERGRLVLAGRTLEDLPFGIVIFEAETEAEARSIMADDPAVQGGVMTAVLHPYRVALIRGG